MFSEQIHANISRHAESQSARDAESHADLSDRRLSVCCASPAGPGQAGLTYVGENIPHQFC